MIHVGQIEANFNVKAQSMDVCFDPRTEQQYLSFKLALNISLPQLLQQLVKFQCTDGMPHNVPDASAPAQAHFAPAQPPDSLVRQPPDSLARQPPDSLPRQPPDSLTRRPSEASLGQAAITDAIQPVTIPPHSDHGQAQRDSHSEVAIVQHDGTMPAVGTANTPLNMRLIDALRQNNISEVHLAVQQRADVNCVESAPHMRMPLHHALEAGGNVEAVNLLLEAEANVNGAMARGKTPLHFAIQQYMNLPPVVIRMLLCAKADLLKPDARGTTPFYSAKMAAMQLSYNQGDRSFSATENTRVRQLLNEVTEQPTVRVVVVDAGEVKRVLFADTQNDKLVFHTETSVGLYSLKKQRMVFIKKLRQLQVSSSVQHMSVNPLLGTIAVFLSILEFKPGQGHTLQNVTIIWPNGQLQDEEPLKLTIQSTVPEGFQGATLPACVALSRSQGPQMLLSRLCDGKVYCWRLNGGRSQLMSEVKLLSRGGLVAISDDGCWIAAVNREDENNEHVQVWSYESVARLNQNPAHLVDMNKRPTSMAIMQHCVDGQSFCLLAMAENSEAGIPPPPVEIFSVMIDGSTSMVYRVKNPSPSPCYLLDFCGGPSVHLLRAHTDGPVLLCNLATAEIHMSHDNPGTGHISISTDRTLLASVENNYFRIYKVSRNATST
mmetsp:Transcript_115270/g.372502  ORF Transcript_115270/g.372502 Transcript_115270/m.372502 type:complete len:661 (-) Transcript_115270:217-2199(-)